MKVAITGTLEGMTKREAQAKMEAIGAAFTDRVTYDTNYLIAAILTSNQAKKAIKIGVEVITQGEFEEFIEAGAFPDNKLPDKPKRTGQPSNFKPLPWVKIAPPNQRDFAITYFDEDGVVTDRRIRVTAEAEMTSASGAVRRYLQAVDYGESRVLTFRKDRILNMKEALKQ